MNEEKTLQLIYLAKEICKTHPLIGVKYKISEKDEGIIIGHPVKKKNKLYVLTYNFNKDEKKSVLFDEDNIL